MLAKQCIITEKQSNHYDDTKKRAHDSQIVRDKKKLKLSYDGPIVGFVALRPKSTAMVIAGRSVHLTTLFPGQA